MNDITLKSVYEHSQALKNGEYSSVELTKAYIAEINEKEDKIGAYISVNEDVALQMAAESDKKRAAGEVLSDIAGIPAGIKDNMCTKGIKTTCASKILENYVPPYNACVIEKLENAGYVLLGKLNMDEFAMGSTTENSAFKVTRNPRDTERVPGGSSGGSAAAVAANEAAYTLGSDTGGSIRQPASFASSLDQIGPMTKTVKDNAMIMNVIAGADVRDATSINREYGDFTSEIGKDVKGLRIGIPKEFFGEGISANVKEAVLNAAKLYEKMGADITWVSMPSIENALSAYYVISSAEASSNLARFDGVRYGVRAKEFEDIDELYKKSRSEGFGAEVKRRIMLGTFALSSGYYDAYYKKALQVRSLVMRDFNAVFDKFDIILSPVAPTAAYKIGEKTSDPLEMYMGDAYSVPINIAGVPALSLPCGKNSDGMPVGMQLIGKAFSEPVLYRAGAAFEQEFVLAGGMDK